MHKGHHRADELSRLTYEYRTSSQERPTARAPVIVPTSRIFLGADSCVMFRSSSRAPLGQNAGRAGWRGPPPAVVGSRLHRFGTLRKSCLLSLCSIETRRLAPVVSRICVILSTASSCTFCSETGSRASIRRATRLISACEVLSPRRSRFLSSDLAWPSQAVKPTKFSFQPKISIVAIDC